MRFEDFIALASCLRVETKSLGKARCRARRRKKPATLGVVAKQSFERFFRFGELGFWFIFVISKVGLARKVPLPVGFSQPEKIVFFGLSIAFSVALFLAH